MSDINTSTGSITSPKGFSASATTAGIKPSGKTDMALVVNEGPEFHAAAVFTSNKVTAAPVKLSRERVENNTLTAVIYNSGNANACTGAQGERDAADMAEQTARLLGVGASDIAVCSTGLIGDTLPMDKIQGGIDALSKSLSDSVEHGHSAAQAIMTTDTVSKEAIYQGEGWSLAGMGKGVGMMAPSLATMLVCLTTDASVDVSKEMLAQATSTTFDCVDIDGSTSTNDTVILMANGASGVTPPSDEFQKALHAVCDSLARQMQADAEGVTKRVSITVESAHDYDQALQAARTIGRDNLFKCAMFGSDPNWGRVVAAVGMAPVQMDPDHISVSFNGQLVCQDSTGAPGAREVDLTGRDIDVRVNLGTQPEGRGHSATVYTTDLSYQYVEINSEYST